MWSNGQVWNNLGNKGWVLAKGVSENIGENKNRAEKIHIFWNTGMKKESVFASLSFLYMGFYEYPEGNYGVWIREGSLKLLPEAWVVCIITAYHGQQPRVRFY